MKTTTNLFTHLANSYLSGNGGMSECVSEWVRRMNRCTSTSRMMSRNRMCSRRQQRWNDALVLLFWWASTKYRRVFAIEWESKYYSVWRCYWWGEDAHGKVPCINSWSGVAHVTTIERTNEWTDRFHWQFLVAGRLLSNIVAVWCWWWWRLEFYYIASGEEAGDR